MSDYKPLHDPGMTPSGPFDLDVEIAVTRRILDETASLNVHSVSEMISAAVSLNNGLRALLAAVEAERGGAC